MAAPTGTPIPTGMLLERTLQLFQASTLEELLAMVYNRDESEHKRKKRIASLCGIVMECAFPPNDQSPDALALKVVDIVSNALVDLIERLVRLYTVPPAQSSLVLGGGAVAANPGYANAVLKVCAERFGQDWQKVIVVDDPGLIGGQIQVEKWLAELHQE